MNIVDPGKGRIFEESFLLCHQHRTYIQILEATVTYGRLVREYNRTMNEAVYCTMHIDFSVQLSQLSKVDME